MTRPHYRRRMRHASERREVDAPLSPVLRAAVRALQAPPAPLDADALWQRIAERIAAADAPIASPLAPDPLEVRP